MEPTKKEYLISEEIDEWAKNNINPQYERLKNLNAKRKFIYNNNTESLYANLITTIKDCYNFMLKKQLNYKEFCDDVDNINNTQNYPFHKDKILFGFTPKILSVIGYQELPLYMTSEHLYTCIKENGFVQGNNIHYHNLSVDLIKTLPFLLPRTFLIAKSNTHPDNLISFIDYPIKDINGKDVPLLTIYNPGGSISFERIKLQSNKLASIYGKDDIQKWLNNFDLSQILYLNKKISQQYQLTTPLDNSVAGLVQPSGFYINNISQYVQKVNLIQNNRKLVSNTKELLLANKAIASDVDFDVNTILHESPIPNLIQIAPTISEEVNNFEQKPAGILDIVGKRFDIDEKGTPTFEGLKSLSKAMEIYSDKHYETARYLFIRDGQIIRHVTVSSQTPSSTTIKPNENFLYSLRTYAENTGSKIVFLHNHPSGYVEPSEADIKLTNYLANFFTRNGESLFSGHIILDHGTYGLYTEKTREWGALINGELKPLSDLRTNIRINSPANTKIANFNPDFSISTQSLIELSEYAKECDDVGTWNTKDWVPCLLLSSNGLVTNFDVIKNHEFENIDILSSKLKQLGREYGSENIVLFPRTSKQFLITERFAQLTRKIKDIYFEKEDGTFELSQFPNGNIFNDLTRGDIKVSDSENYAEEVKIKIESENKKQNDRNNLKTRKEFLSDKTEITDEEIITLLDLPVEKRSKNPEVFTDKSYKELRDNPTELEELAADLKEKPEYLKYHNTYIAKSKLLYQESEVLYNEIPCLIILNEMKLPAYLLPYDYAKDKNGTDVAFADSLKSDVFTDFKRVFNARFKHSIEKGTEQGKDIFFLINNEKLNHDEIKRQLIRFTNGRKSENREGTFLFFSEKDYICYAFESDKNGFITELPKYDLKQIRLADISKPFTPSQETENYSESLASNLNITQKKLEVNELLPSLLLRGEISILKTKKDIENREQRYLNAVTSLKNLNFLIQSGTIKKSNDIFVKNQKESHFFKYVQNLFVENKNQLNKENKIMENEKTVNASKIFGELEKSLGSYTNEYHVMEYLYNRSIQDNIHEKATGLNDENTFGLFDGNPAITDIEGRIKHIEELKKKQSEVLTKYNGYKIIFDSENFIENVPSHFNNKEKNHISEIVETFKNGYEEDVKNNRIQYHFSELYPELKSHNLPKVQTNGENIKYVNFSYGKYGTILPTFSIENNGEEKTLKNFFTKEIKKLEDKNVYIVTDGKEEYEISEDKYNEIASPKNVEEFLNGIEKEYTETQEKNDEIEKNSLNIFEYDGLTYIPVRKLNNEELKLINNREQGEIWKNPIIEKPKNGEVYSLSDFMQKAGKEKPDLFYCIERGKFFTPVENGIINLNEGKIDVHFRKELQEFYNEKITQKIIHQNRPLKFNKEKDVDLMQNVSSVLTEGEIFFQNNKTLGDIRIKFGNPDQDGLSHIIKRRMDKLIQHDEMSIEDAQKETAAILFLALKNISEAPATKETNGRYAIYKDGIKTCIGKDKNGRYIVSGFDFDDTKQEARDSIKSVNAQYGYAPEFLEIYAQVGATYASLSNNISQSQEKSNNISKDEPQKNTDSISQAEEELRKELAAAKKQIKALEKKLEETLGQNSNLQRENSAMKDVTPAKDNTPANESHTVSKTNQNQNAPGRRRNNDIDTKNFSSENAFLTNTPVPKFGLKGNDGKIRIIEGAVFKQQLLDEKDPSANKILLEIPKEDGKSEEIKISEFKYQEIINGIERLNKFKAEMGNKQTLGDWFKAHADYNQALLLDEFKLRENTAANFLHNFKARCLLDARNRDEAIKIAARMVKDMDHKERKRFNKDRKEKGAEEFDNILMDIFDETHAQKELSINDVDIFYDVSLSNNSLERGLSEENRDLNEMKTGDLIPGCEKFKVGDTVPISITTKGFDGKQRKTPKADFKIARVSKNVNPPRALIFNEKTKAMYLISLTDLKNHLKKVERSQLEERNKIAEKDYKKLGYDGPEL